MLIERTSLVCYTLGVKKQLLVSAVRWGGVLWLAGYVLGILLFMVVPQSLLGWVIMPVGVALTLWVLFKKIQADSLGDYLVVAVVWTVIAIVCDYFFLVRVFQPADGYYKLDVYVYYALTFGLPVVVGWRKTTRHLE